MRPDTLANMLQRYRYHVIIVNNPPFVEKAML